ncbi:phage tail family protein [Bacillus cereus]|uniref:distal tail protein Dit n=1 Tax=Bacillus cereus TaxID=1396 RepID=UPI0018F304A2|nr:distal tail protein Dit [Bacillus cereus]MBJ8055726.1 phage tail family protein [Bacillus cereus]
MGKLSFTFNNIRKDYIQMLVGRKRPSWAPIKRNLVRVPHRPGAFFIHTETEERRIDVPLVIKTKKDIADLQKIKEDLANWLYTEQPAELVFDDELDRTYLAFIDGSIDLEEIVNRGKGVITFVCPMPYKLGGTNTHKFTQEWSTKTTSYFTNKGSVEAPALIEMIAKKPSTFLDVWFGKFPTERNYFRIGYPLTVEETTVQERERVMWDEMTTSVGWTPVTGQVEEMKGTGSFKSRDGYALYCQDYGQEKGFHGAIAKKNIPGGPLQDFEMETWVRLKSKSIGEMGRVEVLLLDDTSNIVTRINMNDLYWDAEMTKAYMRIGKEWSVYVARFRDGTEIDDASLVERWIDETGNPMTERKIAQVMISIMSWDVNKPVDVMQIDDLKIWKINKVPSNTKPYIFDTGDKIVIDTERSLVTINGKNAINIKDIFSNFPKVISGDNRIDIMPPDVNATVSYRERYR